MQERKKRRIVIASVLKPVDDTRMFEKIAQSLASDYDVHIIGFPSSVLPHHPQITFHSLAPFRRLSFLRMIAPWKILVKIFRMRPSLLIITTHELLVSAVLLNVFLSIKIVYDVQENYRRNILYTNAFPVFLRPLLALYVSMKEWFCKPFISHYLLAEKGYLNELNFPPLRTTILENKFKRPPALVTPTKRLTGEQIHLLFSGTLSESTGVFTAIDIASQLQAIEKHVSLTIIGFCSQTDIYTRLVSSIKEKPFITLRGGNHLVPYSEIVSEIQRADVGIIAYQINPSTVNSTPTKLFEYLGNQLPILLINHKPWLEKCSPYPAAVTFDPAAFDAEKIIRELKEGKFYTHPPTDVFWESEESKLRAIVHAILSK